MNRSAKTLHRGCRNLLVTKRVPCVPLHTTHAKAVLREDVCFLDADDFLSPDYLRSGMQSFDRYDIGVVYSDMDR
ncbi:MAG: hypothetical protein KDA66_11685, partial [Planctomycetaceae bacterium]|nr:hypothetical protein [Planctomycetaceae bacterium]